MRPQIKILIKDLEGRRAAFYAALEGQDDLGVVVRAHIYIEEELRHFVRVKAPAPEFVDFDGLDYSATLTLALILGLPEKFKAPLKTLGSLRNKFSHRPGMAIDRSAARDLYVKLGPTAQKELRDALKKTQLIRSDRETNVEKMSPKELFCVVCVQLHLYILDLSVSAAALEVKR